MHSLNIFGVRTSHGQTQTHKIHHGPNLGEATTFPFIIYFVPLHKAHNHFVSGLPNRIPEIPKVGIPVTLEPYNFACRLSIEMRSKAKL